ncbi:MAG: hypothetical protein NXI31_18720 [bacterium]|nr:hypothetical protein [bacterium]
MARLRGALLGCALALTAAAQESRALPSNGPELAAIRRCELPQILQRLRAAVDLPPLVANAAWVRRSLDELLVAIGNSY